MGSLGLQHRVGLSVRGGYCPGLGRGAILGSIPPVDDFGGWIWSGGGEHMPHEDFGVRGALAIEKA